MSNETARPTAPMWVAWLGLLVGVMMCAGCVGLVMKVL